MARSPVIDMQGHPLHSKDIVEQVHLGTLFNLKYGWFKAPNQQTMYGWYLFRNENGIQLTAPLTPFVGNHFRLYDNQRNNPELWDKIEGVE